MLRTQNFYTLADTLITGQPSFMGTSRGEQLLRFLIINCVALKTNATNCFPVFDYQGQLYVRFRFLSDSTVSALSGWMIDSIKVEVLGCPGAVTKVTKNNNFDIYPNPSSTSISISSHLPINQITITNLVGRTVYSKNYLDEEEVKVDIEGLQKGIYFVKVNGVEVHKLVKE